MSDKHHERLNFRMRPEYWSAIENELLDSLSGGDAERRASYAAELGNRDLIAEFVEVAGPLGLSEHNVGDILGFLRLVAWTTVNDQPFPDAAVIDGVRQQSVNLIRRNPLMRDERTRALAGGGMLVESVLALESRRAADASDEPAAARTQLADTIHRNMLQKGLDVRANHPTSTGFQPGRADGAAMIA